MLWNRGVSLGQVEGIYIFVSPHAEICSNMLLLFARYIISVPFEQKLFKTHLCRKECVRIADFDDLAFQYDDGGHHLDENVTSTASI